MRVLAAIPLVVTISASANELPSQLLLKCEGKVSVVSEFEGKPNIMDSKFDVTLRLKDGELEDTSSMWMNTKACELKGGVIRCRARSVVNTGDSSEKRELLSVITRDTGEYQHFLQTWSYAGKNATGRERGNMKLRRYGICRAVGKPIF